MFLLDVYLVVDIKITNICKSVIKEYIYVHYESKLLMYNTSSVLKKKILGVVLLNFRKHATAETCGLLNCPIVIIPTKSPPCMLIKLYFLYINGIPSLTFHPLNIPNLYKKTVTF
jgi:hypothetical protein